MSQNRRSFIKTAALGSTLALGLPQLVSAAIEEHGYRPRKLSLNTDDVILFQGDSITDMGRARSRKAANDNKGLGPGYTFIAASELLLKHPAKKLKIYNRGISGNVVPQLIARWQEDCIQLKPDILSILIGVNDYWHTLNGNYKGTAETYRESYDQLLATTKKQLPDVKLVIGEPYAVNHVKVVDDSWFPAFDAYRTAARNLAKKYEAVFIPYQAIYEKAAKLAGPSYWTHDGVHPNTAGDGLMAQAVLEVLR